ncbi:MAG: hypothetical protein RJA52_832 [Bacteroidota bacterium]
MLIRSEYLKDILNWINKPQIKVITGIRRSGKSTVLKLLKNELLNQSISESQIIFLNFESFTTEPLKSAHSLYDHLKNKMVIPQKYYLLLDEIQEVQQWEKVVNSMLVDFDTDIYITGSNSHLLSSELATFIAGRYVEFPIFTLSFKEYTLFRKHYSKDSGSFVHYLRTGGFPVIHSYNYDEEEGYKLVRDIYSSVILRDTVQRYKIRDIELLERLILFVFDNIGNTFSGKNIADYFKSQSRKTDINTIYNYLTALEGAFILYKVSRYDMKGKSILKTQEKFFVADLSLVYALSGYKDRLISGLLENLVFLELKRRGYKVFIGKIGNLEIDFLAERKGKKIYIQVSYKLESETTISREFSPLLEIKDQFPKYVVTMDDFWKENVEGIRHFHISNFLLLPDFDI